MADILKLLCDHLRLSLSNGPVTALPIGGQLIWGWFIDLHRARSWHASGPNPISFTEIDAYIRVTRALIEPRHIEILRAMDWVYIDAQAARSGPPASPAMVSGKRITANLFDAMFGGK